MKKLLITFFIVASFVVFGAPNFAKAQVADHGLFSTYTTTSKLTASNGDSVDITGKDAATARSAVEDFVRRNGGNADQIKAGGDWAATNATQNATTEKAKGEATACAGLDGLSLECLMKVVYSIIDVIGNTILAAAAWILWACGVVFNLAIIQFVIQMKTQVNNIKAIYSVWQIVRDLANMFFIFVLLVIAIQTIFDIGDYKIALRNVILVALFINFSFFFTGVLIDFSNIIALQFYNGFASSKCGGDSTNISSITPNNTADGCISQQVVAALKLGTVYNANAVSSAVTAGTATNNLGVNGAVLSSSQGVGKFLIVVIMGSILMVVAGGVFLASTVLVISRFIQLIICLMFSPLAFATLVLPGMKQYGWSKWWSTLTKQLIFAPVYFMFLWVSMAVITAQGAQNGGSYTSAFNAGSSGKELFGLIVSFVIAIGMLIFSLKLAGELGASGVGLATKVSKGTQNFVRNNTVGLAAKHTIGRGAEALDKRWGKSTGFMGGTGWMGSKLRNVTTAAVAKNKLGGSESFVDHDKREKDRKKAMAEQGRKNINESTLKTGLSALQVTDAQKTAMSVAERTEHDNKIQNLANYAKTAGTKDLTGMKAKEVAALAEAGMLTPDKVSAVLDDKNESHNSAEKDTIRAAYSKKVNTALDTLAATPPPAPLPPGATVAQTTAHTNATLVYQQATRAAKAAIADLGEDGAKIVDPTLTSGRNAKSEAFIQMASGKQYQKIIENTYGDGKNTIRDARFKTILNPAISDPDFIEHFKKLDAADIAHLANNSDARYTAAFNKLVGLPNLIDFVDPRKLTKAWADEGLNPQAARQIRDSIWPSVTPPPPKSKEGKLLAQMDTVNFGT